MQPYKFNATNDDEALKAIQYFKMLGFVQAFDISKIGGIPHHIFAGRGTITWLHNDLKLYKNHSNKEVTLSELQSLVILKRNNPDDATHDSGMFKYIELFDGWYYFDKGSTNKWQKSHSNNGFYSTLKPIQQKKEYLNTKTGQYFESSTGQPRSTDWIEIPAGATFATGKTKPIFRKDCFYWDDEDPIGGDGIPFWRETSINLRNAEVCGLDVVWEREDPSINEIIKTAEEYRQSQNEAPDPSITDKLNDLCDQFGCLPGMDRLTWLREKLEEKSPEQDKSADFMPIVEYLDPSANYKFHQFKLGSQFVPDNWIKVPEGAECCFEYQWEGTAATIDFFKDNRNSFYSTSRCEWLPSGSDPRHKEYAHLIWARDQEVPKSEAPELTDFGLDISSVSTDTVYHYYACPHIPSWPPIDGIILFDGRISSAEDYNRLIGMIAEHINRKPDDFAIRSLTIVG